MGGRDARKKEKERAKKAAQENAVKAERDAVRAAEEKATEAARTDFMERLQAAEVRDGGKLSSQQQKFWKSYFKDLFRDADQDESRELDFEEAEAALGSLGISEEERRFAFEAADADGSGSVDLDEFMRIAPTLSALVNGGGEGAAAAPAVEYAEPRVEYAEPRAEYAETRAQRTGDSRKPSSQSRSRSRHTSKEGSSGDDGVGSSIDPLGLDRDERRRAKQLFRQYDADGSGELDFGEFCRVMEQICPNLDERNLAAAFKAVDVDRSGAVDYDEFMQGQKTLKAWRQKKKPKHTAARRAADRVAGGGRSPPPHEPTFDELVGLTEMHR